MHRDQAVQEGGLMHFLYKIPCNLKFFLLCPDFLQKNVSIWV
ncbi:hypothetical protein HMPREF1986_01279 [Oribacterium sp. oral taxon 078 str. F0263]|nr:hypothetical protein HMPREF1986_01279 [Oribacterium sp. oral taxon 078 str. F0263]